ncbi:hypothetical protein AB0P15_28280 [Streptomyces sp. NPDC087917]|uniref:hypothetical protein n=1 Tax=Streptomyces sp. NPDC087917 TaxID=3155060 RepID=UPI00344179FB
MRREYLALPAVLITGRKDHLAVLPASPDGAPGWAVVEHDMAQDPKGSDDRCAPIAAAARDSARSGAAFEQAWRAS